MADRLSDRAVAGAQIQHANRFIPLPGKQIDEEVQLLLPFGDDEDSSGAAH